MANPMTLDWMDSNQTVLVLTAPVDPDWDSTITGWSKAYATAKDTPHDVAMIFDVRLSPDPPDPRVIAKMSGFLAKYPSNMKTVVVVGASRIAQRSLGILIKTMIPVMRLTATMDEALEIINSRW